MTHKRLDPNRYRTPCTVGPELDGVALADFRETFQPCSRDCGAFGQIDLPRGELSEAADLTGIVPGDDHLNRDLPDQFPNEASESRSARASSDQQRFGGPLDEIERITCPI